MINWIKIIIQIGTSIPALIRIIKDIVAAIKSGAGKDAVKDIEDAVKECKEASCEPAEKRKSILERLRERFRNGRR